MTSDELFDALERCAATSSKKGKLAIVQGLDSDARVWLQWALDPTISFYVDKLPKPTKHGDDVLHQEEDVLLLGRLSKREISGKEALQRIDETMRELTPKSQEMLRRILLKDLRCGVGTSIVNSAFPGLIPVFPYQRCCLPKDSNIEKWDWNDGIYVQLKADGMFAGANVEGPNEVTISSRNGTRFPAGALADLEGMLGTLDKGTQIHGELLVYREGVMLERAEGNGILNSLLQGGELPENHYVTFDVWDQIPISAAVDGGRYEVPYKQRFDALVKQVERLNRAHVQVIDTAVVYSKAEAMRICARYQRQKLEGAICKHPGAIWRDGDNKDQVKLKLEVDVDLVVEAILPGDEGKRTEGRAGRLACSTRCGKLKANVTVKNEAMRDACDARPDLFIGKIMVVRANGITEPTENNPLHSLFLPRFAEASPRLDKLEADDLQRVRDQFEAAIGAEVEEAA